MHVVERVQITPVAGTPLKVKAVFPATVLKFVPVMVTGVPMVPLPGDSEVIVGKTANVKESLEGALVNPSTLIVSGTDVPVPPAMVTVDGMAGLITTQSVLEPPQSTWFVL